MSKAKVEITDEMVERAYAYVASKSAGIPRWMVREVLESALNPPEIAVSEAMEKAGILIHRGFIGRICAGRVADEVAQIYRAMEHQRLREAAEVVPAPAEPWPGARFRVSPWSHTRKEDCVPFSTTTTHLYHARKTDPGGFKPHSMRGLLDCSPKCLPGSPQVWTHHRIGDRQGEPMSLYAHRRKGDPA